MRNRFPHACSLLIVLTVGRGLFAESIPSVPLEKIDAIFSKWTAATPGCSLGVMIDGKVVVERAYGMADLERDVPIVATSIFEAGSVSKQFTAAAVLLLEQDGKLKLDDPIRKYIPEVPDYGTPITIRHMLQHTSGLRDWGVVEGIAGWPRTTRANTHAHVLDIISRQKHVNFTPGTRWSYSNSGYNLAAILVSRVSGMSFSEFTRRRLFEPLGMTHTSWRDDYTQVVKGRALAYRESEGAFKTFMPFENVHGNGGLLTTVGDLLHWNENFVEPRVGGEAFVHELQTPGRLADDTFHAYGLGLFIGEYQGVREVRHSGTTAGYRAYLTRFPDQHLSIAVLCNVSTATPDTYAHAVADLYLADVLKPAPAPKAIQLTTAELDELTGMYRNVDTGSMINLVRDEAGLRMAESGSLTALSANRFQARSGRILEFDGAGGAKMILETGLSQLFERVEAVRPTVDQLREYIGTYRSDEAEVSLSVVVRDGKLEATRRPDSRFEFRPLDADGFDTDIGVVRFHRAADGNVSELSVSVDRVWDLRFRKAGP